MFWALLNPKGTKTTGNNSLFSPSHTSTFYFRYWTDFQLIFSNTRLRLCRDVLENDSRIEVPKNPRAALLAEKFISDRVKRVETKHYIYEGQVDEDGNPHGQVSMVFLLRHLWPVATLRLQLAFLLYLYWYVRVDEQGIKFCPARRPQSPSEKETIATFGPQPTNPFGRRLKLQPPPQEGDFASEHEQWQIGKFSRGKITG